MPVAKSGCAAFAAYFGADIAKTSPLAACGLKISCLTSDSCSSFSYYRLLFLEDNPMFSKSMNIADFDPELWASMQAEEKRQEDHIELIASENYTSPRVMQAQGSVLTNKYAEGYPSKRYYGGCEYVDVAEVLAIDRVKQLFNADYANVQPHSGSQANAAVFFALLNPGDTILGMSLSDGGHLTHGAKVNFSGKLFNAIQYGLNAETGEVDYEQVEALAKEHQPRLIVAGFSAYSRIMDWQRFRDIADSVGAYQQLIFIDKLRGFIFGNDRR